MKIQTAISQKPKLVWAFLFLFLILESSAGFAETDFYSEHIQPIQERAFDSTSQKILLAGAGSVLFARQQDTQVREQWRNHQTMSHDVSKLGDDIGGDYAVGPLIAATQLLIDPVEGKSHTRALIYTGLATWTLKLSVARQRPNGSNTHSFPSGHTSSSFATATSLTYSYGVKAGWVAYPVATYVALSRFADDMHWFSDAVAGAFIGIWMGRANHLTPQEMAVEKTSWNWTPILSSQQAGLWIQKEF